MIHHISIAVASPQHVAEVLAELWQGQAYPFPMYPNSYIAFAGDDRGTAIEVYPAGTELVPDPALPALRESQTGGRYTATHVALSVPLQQADIEHIAAREGWHTVVGQRGPFFQVVELWIENCLLLELLTPAMAAQYCNFSTPQNWEQLVLAGAPA